MCSYVQRLILGITGLRYLYILMSQTTCSHKYSLSFRDADRILVQANTPDFREKHNHEFLGKEAHITSILTKLYNKEHLKIRPEEVILFDDDKENTDIAIRFGHMAFHVQDSIQDINLEDFAKVISASQFRRSWVK